MEMILAQVPKPLVPLCVIDCCARVNRQVLTGCSSFLIEPDMLTDYECGKWIQPSFSVGAYVDS